MSAVHCLTELFSIYQNKHGTIRRRDDHIVVQSSHRNIFKIDGLQFAGPQKQEVINGHISIIVWQKIEVGVVFP